MAIVLDGTNGITTSGNNILGDASTDTLNVGNGGLVKDANGIVSIGATPSAWSVWGSILQGNSYALTGYNNAGNVQSSWWMNSYRNSSGDAIYYSNGPASQLIQSGGTLYYNAASVGTTGSTITWSTPLTLAKDSTVALQGATSVAGTGITFPASQNASSNANTLDDYEEGTWSPELRPSSGGSYSWGQQQGRYIKIGRQVTLHGFVQFSVVGSAGTGQMYLQNFPFATANSNNLSDSSSVSIGRSGGWSGTNPVCGAIVGQTGTSAAELYQRTSSTAAVSDLPASAMTAGAYIAFSITYTAAA